MCEHSYLNGFRCGLIVAVGANMALAPPPLIRRFAPPSPKIREKAYFLFRLYLYTLCSQKLKRLPPGGSCRSLGATEGARATTEVDFALEMLTRCGIGREHSGSVSSPHPSAPRAATFPAGEG